MKTKDRIYVKISFVKIIEHLFLFTVKEVDGILQGFVYDKMQQKDLVGLTKTNDNQLPLIVLRLAGKISLLQC